VRPAALPESEWYFHFPKAVTESLSKIPLVVFFAASPKSVIFRESKAADYKFVKKSIFSCLYMTINI
jgi:hypothetical protein